MNSKVIVLADEKTKAVVNVSENNPDYGYFRVEQSKVVTTGTGWLDVKRITAIVPGKIITLESLEPFSDVNIEKQLKRAGSEDAPVCTLMGKPIYQKRLWTSDANLEDDLISHDNIDEIRAYNANKKSTAVQPNEEFSIGG